MNSAHINLLRLRPRSRRSLPPPPPARSSIASPSLRPRRLVKVSRLKIETLARGRKNPIRFAPVAAMDEDSFSLFDDGDEDSGGYVWSSGEESDTDLVINPDFDLPARREHTASQDSMLTVTAHRFATIQRGYRTNRISGVMLHMGLIAFFTLFLVFIDWCSWRIVRLPLEPFYLTRPFSVSAVLSACVGCLYVPLVDNMKVHQIVRKKGPITHSKRAIPTTGGLFFIPIGITIARGLADQHSVQVYGAAVATTVLAVIGLLGDILSLMNLNHGLPGWIKLLLQLTDGLDGLAGGAAALSFIGMSVAVLAVSPGLAVFGASMAGACIGFLFHNKYKASVLMGETGSLALGGALAAMAACSGMFLPLFISSGVFVLEMLSIAVQGLYLLGTRRRYLATRRILRVAPLYRILLSYGLHESAIVAITYVLSCVLALLAGYVGLISA